MRSYFNFITICFFCILGSGCSKKEPPAPNPAIKYIILTTTEPDPRACVYLGDAETQAKDRELGKAQLDARDQLKSKAFDLKGNTVMLDTTLWNAPGFISSGEVVISGRVFRCDLPKDQTAPTKEGGVDDRRRRSGETNQQDLFDRVQTRSPASSNSAGNGAQDQNLANQGNYGNSQGQSLQNPPNYPTQNFQNNQRNNQYYQGQSSDDGDIYQNNQEPDLFENIRR